MHPTARLGGKEYGVLRRRLGGLVGAKRGSVIQDTAGAAVTHHPSPHGGPAPIGLLSDAVRELAILIFRHGDPDFGAERGLRRFKRYPRSMRLRKERDQKDRGPRFRLDFGTMGFCFATSGVA